MAQFKVIEGTYDDGTKVYHAGEIVTSDKDLLVEIPGKFTKVEEPVHIKTPPPAHPTHSAPTKRK